ncbi:phosphatase PAP2 family protein [Roseateles sp.]|uniref:phosphatase PAP2 family protein n=1 Tax=Roseateles sp. TaxID=1971397 RepID=UPI0025F6F10A|nr:phosphatase PAP2 family protein [Roseateles sp.]MBV8036193.1 phosphatase PAP2 family protein [Roseateles sp.]
MPSLGASLHSPVSWPCRPAPVWCLTLALLAIDGLWIAGQGWRLAVGDLLLLALALCALQLPLLLRRYRRDARIAGTLRAACLLLLFQAGAACMSYLLIALAPPLVDGVLAGWDHLLGLDWPALQRAQARLPETAQVLLRCAYNSGLPQILLVLLYLGLSGRATRLQDFLLRYGVATMLVILLSAPFPAAGAWKHFGTGNGSDLAALAHFEALRDGSLRELALSRMQGLISMPSLHAAMAVLLAHALRGTPLRWPGLVLNLLMLAATPVEGGHYLVDVLAGVALALAVVAWRLPRQS